MTLNFEAEAETLRPRLECIEAETKAEAKNHEAEVEATRPYWP